MMCAALMAMHVGSYVLCCLGSGVFGVGGAMNALQKSPTKLIAEALLSHPAKLLLSNSRSRQGRHIEVLEVRGTFKKIVKYQQKKPEEDMATPLSNRKKKPISLDKGKKLHYLGQTIVAGEGKNTVIITNRKHKSTNKKKIRKGPLMKRNKKKFVERHLRKAKKSKRPNKSQKHPKYRKQKVTMERDNNEMYSEAKRTTPMSRRIEFFRRPRRNNEKVRKRKVSDGRDNSFNNSLERMGLLISVSPYGESYQEFLYGADGETVSKEATTIKNDLRGPHTHADTNKDRRSKEHIETFSSVDTTTINGLEGSELWTHATTTGTEILSQQEVATSKELHIPNNETKSSDPSINTTTVIPVPSLTSSPNEEMANEVTLYVNKNRDNNLMETTASRKMTPKWNNIEALPTITSANFWIKLPLNVQPEEIGSSVVEDQIQMLPLNSSVTHVESSGDSEVHVDQVQSETLHMTKTTQLSSTDRAPPYPTGQDDGNITKMILDGNKEMQDSVYSPLEMVLSHESESKYCKPGYKHHAGACKSMCDLGEFFCEIGGTCVIVEDLGPMCRCHQTNTLCFKGECCRLSLTPLQLICVIGSCCIFVSVFLGSISLLLRRTDIKAASKSVRTSRLWISTLMPGSRSSSFSHLAESDQTSLSEFDSPDFSSFNHRKKMIHDGATLTSEHTPL